MDARQKQSQEVLETRDFTSGYLWLGWLRLRRRKLLNSRLNVEVCESNSSPDSRDSLANGGRGRAFAFVSARWNWPADA